MQSLSVLTEPGAVGVPAVELCFHRQGDVDPVEDEAWILPSMVVSTISTARITTRLSRRGLRW
ncbi:hypothetical protein ADK57_17600 [Streptomyces sp. MMG1533]|nr:hypothetical protein ADK57_17600 [Streptomyces sp. MMG1533]